MKAIHIVQGLVTFVLVASLAACGDEGAGGDDEGVPTDTDADTDSDSDTDSDTDTDSDSDTDSDTDTGGDSDSETDSDSGTDTDTWPSIEELVWVPIEGGTFLQGSYIGNDDERPVHEVTVPSFEMLRTEVTPRQFMECIGDGVCEVPFIQEQWGTFGIEGREDRPMNIIVYDEAVAFCEWAGGRLPSESEWEFAARGQGGDDPLSVGIRHSDL